MRVSSCARTLGPGTTIYVMQRLFGSRRSWLLNVGAGEFMEAGAHA